MPINEAIYVTKSISPDEDGFYDKMSSILNSRVFTNNGPKCQELEKKLADLTGNPHLALCANGTLGLELALHAAGMAGKRIITTPFSYVATVSAALWVGCEIVFADIEEDTLGISAHKIADLMTDETAGVLAVNVYGHPCDYAGISIACGAQKPVIYDAAQAFGSTLDGKPLLSFGDFAVCSFHATKAFHTLEGGCVVCHNQTDLEKLRLLRAFGHIGDKHYCLGINAKMSEAHAAMGLAILPVIEKHRQERKRIAAIYDEMIDRAHVAIPVVPKAFESNFTYYPVIFESEKILRRVIHALYGLNVYPRRYFYPSLNTLPYVKKYSCPVSESMAPRVLCLPIYSGLPDDALFKIVEVINNTLNSRV